MLTACSKSINSPFLGMKIAGLSKCVIEKNLRLNSNYKMQVRVIGARDFETE